MFAISRVEIASMPWGVLQDRHGESQNGTSATLKNLDGSNATTWSAVTGGSSSTASLTADSNGNLPRFVEGGQYTLDVPALGVSGRRVEAVSGSVERGTVFPEAYGAVGDGTTDDTAALQAAVNAWASGQNATLYLKPATSYRVTATIEIKPQSGVSFRGQMVASGATPVTWAGGNGVDATRKFVFRVQGLKRSRIEAVNIQIPASATYVHGWELDNVPGVAPAGTYTSLSQVTFADCHVFGSTGNTGCGGWRIGHSDTATTDFSFIDLDNCGTAFAAVNTGQFHVLQEGANALNNNLIGGYAYFCDVAVGNKSSTGAATATGGGALYVKGFGTSHCNTDFQFLNTGTYVVDGGRFEVGQRFLDIANGGGSNAAVSVTFNGPTLASYVPADNILFYLGSAANLTLVNPTIKADGGSDYTTAMITASSAGTGRGSLAIIGGSIQAPDPAWTISAGAWSITTLGVSRRTNAGANTAHWKQRVALAGATNTNVMETQPEAASTDIIWNQIAARTRHGWDGTVALEGAGSAGAAVAADMLGSARAVILARGIGSTSAIGEKLRVSAAGNLRIPQAGNGIEIKEGTNARMGVATLVAGTVVVSTTQVTATSRIQLTIQSLGTVAAPKAIGVTARTAGTSFTITSADATDTSVIAWVIVEPAP